jgi:nucleotide-binding universal stress UspA family protein
MRAIRRILCPIDLSDVSRYAVNHAVQVAERYRASITALHVWNPILIPSTNFALVSAGSVSPALTEAEIDDVREQVLSSFAGLHAVDLNVLVESGDPSRQILEAAGHLPADLIVIGTHGTGGFQHLVLGSVAEKVLRQAACPVMTVPPRSHATSKLPFERILCPVDFSEPSLAALELAFSLAGEGHASVTILHVLESLHDALAARLGADDRRAIECDAMSKMRALVSDPVRHTCGVTTRVTHGKAYREVLGVAAHERADLIVMGVHGRHALDLMLFGSTTNQVVRRATCPVLTLRG